MINRGEVHKGSRVRFTAQFAKTIRPRKGIDWTTRLGTIVNEPRWTSACIGVMWDGTKTIVAEPKGALEVVSEQG